MAERRSLASAVSTPSPGVDTEVMKAFVTQNKIEERPIMAAIGIADELVSSRIETRVEVGDLRSGSKLRKKSSRFQPVGLIPVTVRLRPDIAGALKRASLERELEGEDIFTQQDLVENALEPWLKQNGFLA